MHYPIAFSKISHDFLSKGATLNGGLNQILKVFISHTFYNLIIPFSYIQEIV
jgi:hypothetical protein